MSQTRSEGNRSRDRQEKKDYKYDILNFKKRQISNWTAKAQADNILTLCDIEMVINAISIRFEQDLYN